MVIYVMACFIVFLVMVRNFIKSKIVQRKTKVLLVLLLAVIFFYLCWRILFLVMEGAFPKIDDDSFGKTVSGKETQYWAGRDTLELFGQGRYQLVRGEKIIL